MAGTSSPKATRPWPARLGYSYVNEDSTIGVLEYDRQIVTFSLTQEF